MTTWIIVGAVALALWVLSCLLMMLFAHRLPNGLLRQVAEFLPACVTTARTLALIDCRVTSGLRARRFGDGPRRGCSGSATAGMRRHLADLRGSGPQGIEP